MTDEESIIQIMKDANVWQIGKGEMVMSERKLTELAKKLSTYMISERSKAWKNGYNEGWDNALDNVSINIS